MATPRVTLVQSRFRSALGCQSERQNIGGARQAQLTRGNGKSPAAIHQVIHQQDRWLRLFPQGLRDLGWNGEPVPYFRESLGTVSAVASARNILVEPQGSEEGQVPRRGEPLCQGGHQLGPRQ